MNIIRIILLILFAEIWNSLGQVLFKKSMNAIDVQSLRGIRGHIRFISDIIGRPTIWLGFCSMAMGITVWFVALAGADLSIVSPMGSMQYIIILAAAHFFLNEKISRLKLTGTLLVVLGIALLAVS